MRQDRSHAEAPRNYGFPAPLAGPEDSNVRQEPD